MAVFKAHIYKGKEVQLGYNFYRAGENLLILFPGFGQDAKLFVYFVSKLHANYSLLAIDHFQHGASQIYKENTALDKEVFNATLAELVESLGFSTSKIVLGGFSFGNWLTCSALHSSQLNTKGWILLSAPPLRFSRLFYFSTQTILGKSIFRFYTIQNNWLKTILIFLEKTKILPKERVKIAYSQVVNSDKSTRLYKNWLQMRHFIPKWPDCIKMAQKKDLKCLFVGGVKDKITPIKSMKPLFEEEKNTKFLLFDGGHTFVNNDIIVGLNRFLEEIDN
jgi:pimeloyl-ACP methyl ester carboxylesterase